jgi:hypothetical protein
MSRRIRCANGPIASNPHRKPYSDGKLDIDQRRHQRSASQRFPAVSGAASNEVIDEKIKGATSVNGPGYVKTQNSSHSCPDGGSQKTHSSSHVTKLRRDFFDPAK